MKEQPLGCDPKRDQIYENPEHKQKVYSAFEKAVEILLKLNKFDEQLQISMRAGVENHVGGGKLHGYIEQAFIQHITKLGLENRFKTAKFNIEYKQSITRDGTIINIYFKRLGNVKKIRDPQRLYSKWHVIVSNAETTNQHQEKKITIYCEATFNLIGPDPKYIRPHDTQIELDFGN
ncbi:hypothetical protein COV56_02940 [Candidatus Kuenenbacteria bacterium CG11_big_fil_rev_8_21_14_0_20_37_9]|nr:MAG: hypothetical protein COV56_02940 [Candidatus Kuenenbacteria bacterium CG11_big_fil_rev_8_21_14_0_20_37_9]